MTLSATPKSLSISSIASPPINNNRQQIITHFSPILTRRSKIEHGLPSRSISPRDIPTNFIFRPPMSHRSSSLKLDSRLKTIAEHPVKSPLIPSISIPRLSEQDSIHTRTLTSTLYAKSRLIKQWRKHHHSSPLNNFDQINDIEQLSINARLMNNYHREDSIKQSKCQLKDDGKYSITFLHRMIFFIESEMNILFVTFKSKIENFSIYRKRFWSSTSLRWKQFHIHLSVSINTSKLFGNRFTLFLILLIIIEKHTEETYLSSTTDLQSCSTTCHGIFRWWRNRWSHLILCCFLQKKEKIVFFPIDIYICISIESLNDMKKKLVENYSIRPMNKDKHIHSLIDKDETSLTFDILNQEETKFEKQLYKSRRLH